MFTRTMRKRISLWVFLFYSLIDLKSFVGLSRCEGNLLCVLIWHKIPQQFIFNTPFVFWNSNFFLFLVNTHIMYRPCNLHWRIFMLSCRIKRKNIDGTEDASWLQTLQFRGHSHQQAETGIKLNFHGDVRVKCIFKNKHRALLVCAIFVCEPVVSLYLTPPLP